MKSLSEGMSIVRSVALLKDVETRALESRKEQFILETLESLTPKTQPREITTALQHIISSIGRFSQGTRSSPIVPLWIQFGLIPRLLCLLMDQSRCTPGIFQLIKNVFRGLIHFEEELASKGIILYICRALQNHGLRYRAILVLISSLIEIPGFRKIAIEHFDLGQNFGRLLLLGRSPCHVSDSMTDNSSSGLTSSSNHDSYPPIHVVSEQQHLPIEATLTWRVPPVPLHSNPPEDSLSQISILKNLLLLSPLNNEGVEFRTGHLTAMLLAFIDCGLAQRVHDQPALAGTSSARELDDAWFFVFRLVLANIHEHCYHHPNKLNIMDKPQLIMVKPRMELRALEGFVKQVLTMIPVRGNRHYVRIGFKLLMELITSTPSPILATLVASSLVDLVSSIRLSPTQQEVQSGSRSSAHLSLFSLLIEVLKRVQPCPCDLIKALVRKNIVKTLFQIIEYSTEQKELNRMDDEEVVVWIQKCWRLLTALMKMFRQSMPDHEDAQTLFNEIEDQFIQELKDPFRFDCSDSVDVLASLEFLVVYLDHRQCGVYKHEDVFLRILKWLRETLNRCWIDKDSDLLVGCLEVVAVIGGNIPGGSHGVLQVFIDGLLHALDWIDKQNGTEKVQKLASDRTVRLEAILPEVGSSKWRSNDWRISQPGPSRPPRRSRKSNKIPEPEIQPDWSNESRPDEVGSRTRTEESDSLRSFPLGGDSTSPSSSRIEEVRKRPVIDTSSKLEDFRAKHELYSSSKKQPNQTHVIPPLNLTPLISNEVYYVDQRSMVSTEYSSELPVRPLSQISDFSEIPSMHEGAGYKASASLLPMDSSLMEQSPTSSRLGLKLDGQEVQGRRAYTAPLQYFDHEGEASLEIAKDLIEQESPKKLPSRHSTPWNDTSIPHLEMDLQPGKLTLEKRANSTSAMMELAADAGSQFKTNKTTVDSSSFFKMHSFDTRPSRQSLAMQQLVGQRDPVEEDSLNDEDQELNSQTLTRKSLSNIVLLDALDLDKRKDSTLQISEGISVEMDVLSGTNITLFAGSEMPEMYDLDVELLFNEKIEDGPEVNGLKSESSAILAAKYRLSNCELILDDHRVHISVIKVFLKLLLSEYSAQTAERYLSRVISLGLHRHLHFLPKSSTLMLKDWAIQEEERGYYLLLKLLSRQLFDEGHYPSLKRIGRGVFSSIHECSCPVLGGPSKCCAKVVDLPKDTHDIRSIKDLFIELAVLHRLQHLSQVVSLYDYGCTRDNLYLITKLYKTDLRSWRQGIMTESPLPCAKMMFKIFLEILKAVDSVHRAGVVHFDLKCSNVVLNPTNKDNLYDWNENQELPFDVVLADFGEALFIESIPFAGQRSRGTQAFMSPEVLVAGSGGRRIAPSTSSDTWSLGCLLFELITGEHLFDDSDYSEFHTRLTTTSRTLIDAKRVELIPESIREPTLLCLSYLLVRNPALRAPIHAVMEWVEYLLASTVLPAPGDVTGSLGGPSGMTVRNFRGLENYVILPEHEDLEIRSEFVPVSPRVCILSLSLARDPWTLAQYQITHVVFVYFPSEEDPRPLIQNSTVRATAALIQIQLSTNEEHSITSWIDNCRKSCEFILNSTQNLEPCFAIVPGHKTRHYVQLVAQYLSHHGHQTINLDSSLLT